MLSIVNIIKDYKNDKKRLRELIKKDKEEAILIYMELCRYQEIITINKVKEEILLNMIESKIKIIDDLITKNNYTCPTYKGKTPILTKERLKKMKKIIDKIEEC